MTVPKPIVNQCSNRPPYTVNEYHAERQIHPSGAQPGQFYAEQVEDYGSHNTVEAVQNAIRNDDDEANCDSG